MHKLFSSSTSTRQRLHVNIGSKNFIDEKQFLQRKEIFLFPQDSQNCGNKKSNKVDIKKTAKLLNFALSY